ncbi:MAG: sulfatase-like hydrolase/transferase [Rikenellaceae bacterium]
MNFIKNITMASAVVGSAFTANAAPQRAEQPNVVFILLDDVSYFNLPAYGMESISLAGNARSVDREKVETPNIDRLAEQGVLCTQAYAHALSEATRVALMTGMNNGRNYLATKALHESQITFGDVFQYNGYATGMYGKWKQSRGTKENPPATHISTFGWDDYACFDMVTADQRYINPDLVVNDKVTDYRKTTEIDPKTGRRYYGPDIFNYRALEFIEKNKEKPFFLYYPMALIHSEIKPTPDSKDGTFSTTEETKKNNDNRYLPDMIRYMDKMIGRVVDKIETLGLRENTLIVVMGDNGSQAHYFNMTDGTIHQGGKGQTTYAGEQVPLIFSMPGKIPAKTKYEGYVDVTDLYPTIIKASGNEIPNAEKIDGISIWDQITGKSTEPTRDCIYKWYNRNSPMEEEFYKIRYAYTKDFKYYAPHDIYKQGRFFDLRLDPNEKFGKENPRTLGFNKWWMSGIPLAQLTAEQQRAYKKLKAVVDKNAYVKVESIKIGTAPATIKVGKSVVVEHTVSPSNATINGVIWESSDPTIATVDKFGTIKGLKKGKATITLYSWDDAHPLANGVKTGGYKRDGMKDTIAVTVK